MSLLVSLSPITLLFISWKPVVAFDVTLLIIGVAFNLYWALYQVYLHGDFEIRMPTPPTAVISGEQVKIIEEEIEIHDCNDGGSSEVPEVCFPNAVDVKFSIDDGEDDD